MVRNSYAKTIILFASALVLSQTTKADDLPVTKTKDTPAVYVMPSGDFTNYVGVFQLDDELFNAQNLRLIGLGKPALVADIEIKADGTFRRINGTTASQTVITGTVQATSTMVVLSAYRVNGEIATLPSDKAIFKLVLSEDGNYLKTMGQGLASSRVLRFRRAQ